RCFFFFQAEDGIRDFHVTGVQTCALPDLIRTASALYSSVNFRLLVDISCPPISALSTSCKVSAKSGEAQSVCLMLTAHSPLPLEIGRASCRERVQTPRCGGPSTE